jgi:hypothetical protein
MKFVNLDLGHRTLFSAVLFLCTGTAASAQSWHVESIGTPAPPHSSVPRLTEGQSGKILLSWMEKAPDGLAFRFASWRDSHWSASQTIAEGPQLLAATSSEPGVIELPGGALVAQWLTKAAKAEANDIVMAVSRDAGRTWSNPVKPYRDSTPGEHMYVSLFPWPGGGAGAVWLDPRGGKTSLLIQTTIDESGKLGLETVIAGDVCECCPTSSTVTSAGPVVLYRNRSALNIRDMYLSRFLSGRMQAGTPIYRDGWQINGCPTNSGSVTAIGNRIAAAWFTASSGDPRIELAFSKGDGFQKPLIVDDAKPVGRVAVAPLKDGSVMVTWLARGTRGTVLRGREASADGALGSPIDLESVRPNGKLGFPFAVGIPDGIMMVWTDWNGNEALGLRAAILTKNNVR